MGPRPFFSRPRQDQDLNLQDQDQDQDLSSRDQDQDQDLSLQDQDRDQDLSLQDQDQDQDLTLITKTKAKTLLQVSIKDNFKSCCQSSIARTARL